MTSTWQGYELSKHLTLGVGIGIGIGLVLRRYLQQRDEQRKQLCESLEKLIGEVKHLRESLLHSKQGDREDVVDGNSRQASESDDEEDFFEMAFGDNENVGNDNLSIEDLRVPRTVDLDELFVKVDKLSKGNDKDKEEGYHVLESQIKLTPDNSEVLWRYGRALCDVASLRGYQGDIEAKKALLQKGIQSAKASLDINSEVANAHKWYALLEGSNIEFLPVEEKIKKGFVYKEHIEKAIALKPSDPSCYSLLARWCYEVYMMPWYIRKVATALFAEPPSATIDEALENFLKAEELRPGFWKTNTMFIGKCYYQKSDYARAKEWLLKAKNLPVKEAEDEQSQKEINSLLSKL